MAGLADMIVQSGLNSSQNAAPDIAGGISKGVQLAGHIESIQQSREKLEMEKENVRVQKAERIMTAIEAGSKFTDKQAQGIYFKNHVPSMVRALKMEDVFNPDLMPYLQSSEEVRNKIIGLKLDIQDKIQSGQLRGVGILDYAKSKLTPEELPLLDTNSLLDQQKLAYIEGNKTLRTDMSSTATTERAVQARAATGDVEEQKKTADLWTAYTASGGEAGARSRIKKLKTAREMLVSNKVVLGNVPKKVPFGSHLDVLARTDPKAKALIDTIRSSINVKMRTGDPNPTETQINQIYNQAIDARLSNQDNISKLDAEIEAEEKADYDARNQFSRMGKKVNTTERKYWNGKTYEKVGDKWIEVE